VLAAQAAPSELSWAFRSHHGVLRAENEDYVGAYPNAVAEERGPLFVVADGMGGHAAGEVASRIAVETVLDAWVAGSETAPRQALRAAARAANSAVFEASFDHARRGMGTTLTALALAGGEALIAHVGDSRAYQVRDGQCSQLTSDHSRVAEMLRMRLISPEQAANHPARAMLTRSLGGEPAVQVDLVRTDAMPGDVFVLCSDGLWDLVSRRDIIEATGADVESAAERLLALALERGAPDNVSVVVVRINPDASLPPVGQERSRLSFLRRVKNRLPVAILIPSVFLALWRA
jgi:PPM family protein phosphatase